jgi:hypothetical protein
VALKEVLQMADPVTPVTGSQAEYDHLLSYFKYLVTISVAFLTILIGAGTYMFHSNMKDVRDGAKGEATRVATSEAKIAVAQAFDEKNINAMILSTAQRKIETMTDKVIEQQLTTKLRPIQQRILLIGQVSESETRMRMGFRTGYNDLKALTKVSDGDVGRFAKTTLETTSESFDSRFQEGMKLKGTKGLPMLSALMSNVGRPQQSWPSNLSMVVKLIREDSDLNLVAAAFLVFRELTGSNVKMFNFDAVNTWCAQNEPKFQTGH